MSVGASNIDPATHPLLSSLYFGFSPRQTSFTYSFAPAGDVVVKAGYVGGSDFTRAWTQEEEAIFRSIAARFSQVAQIAFVEVGSGTGADINLQIVEEVAGGFGGYASTGGETYVVGDAEPGLLTHELGHTAYLDHPFDGTTLPGVGDTFDPGDFGLNSTYYSIMAYRSGTPNGFGSLTDMPANVGLAALDIAMLQALYGANTTFAAGADTYGAQTAFHTIWDAGGYDTLDYSTASGNSRIDLRAATLEVADGGGGFVSLLNVTGGGAAGGYTIAYGVTIEAGLGGSGDDTLIGNGAANLLRGGLGNDTLHGGGGNDRLDGAQPGAAILPITLAELNTAGGANGRALRVEDYSLPGNFTLDMAVRIDPGTNALQTLVDHAPATSGAPGFELRLWTDDFPSLWLVLRNPGNSFSVQFSGITKEAIADGDFHRVTLTRDTASGEMRVYLDGVFMRAETYRPGEVMAPDSVLSFGQRGVGINPLNGDMGPVAVHDTRLSDQDIAARSLSDLADPAESGLLSYWVPGGAGSTGGVIADQTGGPGLAMTGGATLFTVPLNTDDDLLRGEGGNDTLTGGLGNDTLDGGTQDDRLTGGAGNDRYLFAFDTGGSDTLSEAQGSGTDTLHITDRAGTDLEFRRSGTMLVVEEQGNAHRILAEDHFSGIPTDRIELVEALDGLRYLKTGITGTATADILVGASGNDLITGADGDDLLFGGAGDDTLAGGADDDLLQGGAGADRLAGGTGNDIYRFAFDTDGRDTLSEASGNGTDTLDITDRDIADLGLRRSGTVLVIEDPAGENRVVIEDHFSGIATSRIEIVQDTGALRFFKTGLAGTATSDIIVGASGAETLTGAAGDDILVGGGAKDALYGGAGADVFLFAQISDSTAAAAGRDTIYDFSKSDGDRIALAGIDANTGLAGDNAFVFVGQGPTTGAGTLVYSFAGANTLVQADVNGGGADFSILLAGTLSLSVGDFIL